MGDQVELILIFAAVICGVVSAAYFYETSDIFVTLLKKPLRLIASGMFIIAIGVLIAAFINYEAKIGYDVYFYGLPLQIVFYILYIIGSVMIALGAKQFSRKPVQA